MKSSILAVALVLGPLTGHGGDAPNARSESAVDAGRDLSTDPRFEIRTSWANSYSIKGFPEVIFDQNPSLDTAFIKISTKTENGQFYTVMNFERGKPAPEPFHFFVSRDAAKLVTIQFSEVLFSGGDTLHLNLEELLVKLRTN